MQSIKLVPVLPVSIDLLRSLVGPLRAEYGLPVEVDTARAFDSDVAYDLSRGQSNSSALLAELLRLNPDHDGKLLGITSVDLFIPVLTFVFGEAQLDNRGSVASCCRLREEFYGMTPNEPLFRQRMLKEAVHELGHTFGLLHCSNYECAMHSSTSVDDIDIKGSALCPECSALIANRKNQTASD
ncbi:MAG TPA: archaemetzincin [Bacteroidota bacterium]|nr:archaemetzincin [Bacteroidota bacterium]